MPSLTHRRAIRAPAAPISHTQPASNSRVHPPIFHNPAPPTMAALFHQMGRLRRHSGETLARLGRRFGGALALLRRWFFTPPILQPLPKPQLTPHPPIFFPCPPPMHHLQLRATPQRLLLIGTCSFLG